jgi:hypothetical protein
MGGSEKNGALAVGRRSWLGFKLFNQSFKKHDKFLHVFAKSFMRFRIKPLKIIQFFKFSIKSIGMFHVSDLICIDLQ